MTSKLFFNKYRSVLLLLLTLTILTLIYWPTLLTQINGGNSPYMDDVGEIQVSLNVWGTVHMTGYPLYAILGNIVVSVLRTIGVNPATAPSLYSLMWGYITLSVFYLLVYRCISLHDAGIAAVATFLLGLTRTVWTHHVIAEVYSMSLAFQVILLTIALWPKLDEKNVRRRIFLLALVGGFGVFHHRLIGLLTPGLLLAVLPTLFKLPRKQIVTTLLLALPIGLIGFLPYLYLPARALAGANWVYGDPSTLEGFMHEFLGREAAYLMKTPASIEALIGDIGKTFQIIGIEMMPFFAVVGGIILLFWSVYCAPRGIMMYRQSLICFTSTIGYWLFLFFLHRVVMPEAVAMPIVMSLVLGISVGFSEWYILNTPPFPWRMPLKTVGMWFFLIGVTLVPAHRDFVYNLTHNDTGVRMIELASSIPPEDRPNAVVMFPWGPRFTAVAFSKYVTGENADLEIADHKANFAEMIRAGKVIYTASDTFYGPPFNSQPLSWFGEKIYLTVEGKDLIAVRRDPLRAEQVSPDRPTVAYGITIHKVDLCTTADEIHLLVTWRAEKTPDVNLSVFVHLLGSESPIPLAQADNSAPVFNWYPTSQWSTGELVPDFYVLPRLPEGFQVSFGMYEQKDGQFLNYGTRILNLDSAPSCEE